MLKIALIGKPNVGKSTLFSALTFSQAEIANYPFTTVKPNIGVGYVITKCPDIEIGKKCNPREGRCNGGRRLVPVEIIDVPGLIPGASEGKGMGNEFLDYIREAEIIIHVFDTSGKISSEGEPISVDSDQWEDVISVEREMVLWLSSRIYRDWDKFSRKADASQERPEKILHERLASYGISEHQTTGLLSGLSLPRKFSHWKKEDAEKLVNEIFKKVKPIVRVGNRADLSSKERLQSFLKEDDKCFFVSGGYELLLEKASKIGLVKDDGSTIKATGKGTQEQMNALEGIIKFYSNTIHSRVWEVLSHVVFNVMNYSVVYPVADESTWSDSKGNVLPDAILIPPGTTSLDLAFRIHSDIGSGFIRAIDCRKKMAVRKDYVLNSADVIKIVSKTT